MRWIKAALPMYVMTLKKICASGLAAISFALSFPAGVQAVSDVSREKSAPLVQTVPSGDVAVRPLDKPATDRPKDLQNRAVLTGSPDRSYRNQTITEDVVWRGEILIEGGVTIATQSTLTIEPGTVVRFRRTDEEGGDNPLLLVHGRILALGGSEKPVLFTSNFVEPQPGDWQGIVIMASEKKNLLENCRIAGAETGIEALFSTINTKNVVFAACGTGARIQDCLAVMSGGGASGCVVGLNLLESEVDLRDSNFSGNRQAVVAVKTSLYLGGATFYGNDQEALRVESSRVRITGNSFSVNGSGISLSLCEGTVSANRILKNTDYGLSLAKSRVKVNGNEIAQNGKNGLRVEDGKGIAWGNTFAANGEYDLYNAGTEDFKAMGNWWGDGTPFSKRIYDRRSDAGRGRVYYIPVLRSKPQSDI